jgi:hypothetical protein
MSAADIVSKLWNYCNVLRDDLSACVHAQAGGMSYGAYVEAAPRQLLPALPYLLHPCSRAHPCARPLSAPAFRGITTSMYVTAIRTSLFSTVDVCPHPGPLPEGEGAWCVIATICSITAADSGALRFYE